VAEKQTARSMAAEESVHWSTFHKKGLKKIFSSVLLKYEETNQRFL